MKDWSPDHPRAKVMARKRAAIVAAAEQAFVRDGYAGTGMESIAREAGVSIMTLYRHARTKDDLFAAVIESACHPADMEESAKIDDAMKKPLADILLFIGVMFQERVRGPKTTHLLRVVMTELRRFPHLGELAYNGLINAHVERLDAFLSARDETSGMPEERRRKIGHDFFERLIGLDAYRVLLGLSPPSAHDIRKRAERAAQELLAELQGDRTAPRPRES
ncbi:TetR/AcrR family transcriptional regulator [Luteibacter aegosomatis]|jgi:TetR/AcrR family transcriptional repressor of mexJK operon|uniref:TetR/AcrR family transcriptional regulator n=1 Tax=Luteibacter aegosomatis TaxID=2911537 RepID=UPI001FFB4FAE|nr:TetR/AcrR family transcriptional regulator [Luteibacter aegosomatis]UPG84054.1 TetR/AcrR family transcriptional regulator [Luteibacter aegosomatis]